MSEFSYTAQTIQSSELLEDLKQIYYSFIIHYAWPVHSLAVLAVEVIRMIGFSLPLDVSLLYHALTLVTDVLPFAGSILTVITLLAQGSENKEAVHIEVSQCAPHHTFSRPIHSLHRALKTKQIDR